MNEPKFWRVFACVLGAFAMLAVDGLAGEPEERMPLDLDTALRMALSANLTIREGALLPEIGRQRVREEGGAFDPELELSRIRNSDTSAQPLDPFGARPPASEVLSDDYEAAIRGSLPTGGTYRAGLSTRNLRGTFNSFADDYYSFLGVSLTQPLLRNAGTSPALAALRFARTEREAYEWSYRQVIHDIVTWTALAYFDLVRARDALRVAERSVELGEQLVRDNQRRHERGAMSTQDVVEAQARAARRRDVLLDARLMSSAAENRLKRFLYADFASMERIQIEPLRVPLDPPTEADVAAALAGALEARPDYQLASLEVDQRRIDHSLARSRALPAVDLVASYGYNGNDASFSDSFSHIRERESEAYSIGAIVTVPLPNRSRSARRRIAELDVKRAELALEDFAQEVWRQLADARRALEVTRERVDASRHARDLASRSLEAEEKRLRAGTSTTFLVLEQQESLAEMELREARAEADLASAVAEFHRLTGRTLEAFRLDPALVPTGLQ